MTAHAIGRRRWLTGPAVVAALVGLACTPASAAPHPRLAVSLTVNATLFNPPAGTVGLFVHGLTGPSTCSLTVVPKVPFSVPSRCGKTTTKSPAWAIVRLPPNAGSTPASYRFTLTATTGAASGTSSVTVRVEGSLWHTHTWSSLTPAAATGFSCSGGPTRQPAIGDCVLVGPNGRATIYHRLGGSTTTDVDGTRRLLTVSCVPGGLDCVALDAAGGDVALHGTTWTAPTPFFNGDVPDALDCMTLPAPTFDMQCVAADTQGHVFVGTFATTQTVTRFAVGLTGPTTVACVTPALCVVVDRAGRFAVWHNGAWTTRPGFLDAAGGVTSVACEPDHTCVATDANGGIVGFALRQDTAVGATRHTTASIVHRAVPALAASCAMYFCLVDLGGGLFVQGVGSVYALTHAVTTPAGSSPLAVTCASAATSVWCGSASRRSGATGATSVVSGWVARVS